MAVIYLVIKNIYLMGYRLKCVNLWFLKSMLTSPLCYNNIFNNRELVSILNLLNIL